MRKPNFTDAKLKQGRAVEHFHSVEGLADEFVAQQRDSLMRQEHADSGRWWVKFSESPPPDISLAAADCIQNARTALDYVAFALGEHFGASKTQRGKLGFPFYMRARRKITLDAHGRKRQLDGVENSVLFKVLDGHKPLQAIVKRHQPYRNFPVRRYPLWVLPKLSNTDKHARLNSSTTALMEVKQFRSMGFPPEVTVDWTWVNATAYTEAPSPVWDLRSDTGSPEEHNVYVQEGTAVYILFDPSVPRVAKKPVIPILRRIIDKVEEVIRDFEDAFV